jgi:hypothetical protein
MQGTLGDLYNNFSRQSLAKVKFKCIVAAQFKYI